MATKTATPDISYSDEPTVSTLTTPFVEPTDCSRVWEHGPGSSYVIEVTTGSHLSDCRPTDFRIPNLYPAVCPSGWVYHSITSSTRYVSKHGELVSTIPGMAATCCPSGYYPYNNAYDYDKPAYYGYCGSYITPGQTTITAAPDPAAGATETATFSDRSIVMYRAQWVVGWADSDRSTLSPKPPTIAVSTNIIQSWVPGEPANETAPLPEDYYYRKSHHWTSEKYFIAIGIPLIALAVCVGCWVVFCCCHKRKAKRTAAIQDNNGQAAQKPGDAHGGVTSG